MLLEYAVGFRIEQEAMSGKKSGRPARLPAAQLIFSHR